jgi:hypothetical protein
MKGLNKLECLSLASLFSLVYYLGVSGACPNEECPISELHLGTDKLYEVYVNVIEVFYCTTDEAAK